MQTLLDEYGSNAVRRTLVPWALEEPAVPLSVASDERRSAFGDPELALMYSGTYGRAHTTSDILNLSRALRDSGAMLAVSARGNRVEDLKKTVTPEDSNVHFVPFAPPEKLQERLAAADIHIVSLREEWTGTVVPSKFFGALAIGRPVLFIGSRASSVAQWIDKYGVGWVWEQHRAGELTAELNEFVRDPQRMAAMRHHCHSVYRRFFSKQSTLQAWNHELRDLLRPQTQEEIPSEKILVS
jgi:colanic acid biosynthesis glycosyl transferase WcaI